MCKEREEMLWLLFRGMLGMHIWYLFLAYYAPLSRGRRPSRGAFVFYVHFCLLYILNILTLQQKKWKPLLDAWIVTTIYTFTIGYYIY